MRRRPFVAHALAALLLTASSHPALAAWTNLPTVNLPVSTAASSQQATRIVGDGSGGAILCWTDNRGGAFSDIYAQHVLATGAVDPAWPVNGQALTTAADNQFAPVIVSDGAGGAIVAWTDARSGLETDIYAQHVLVTGAVDPAWPANGRALCIVGNNQTEASIVGDGAGGAIVAWKDFRNGISDVYAQRVLASGAVDPAWPVNGRALCTDPANQFGPFVVSDGAGGAIATWEDSRNGVLDIFAQHVLASGAVDPAWPVDGRGVCTDPGFQGSPTIVGDGAGGALIAWQDGRNLANVDIYAQHVLASGALDASWPAFGTLVCAATASQSGPRIATDGAGGAIVTWYDGRNGANSDIYAQHVLVSGTTDPAWPTDGRALCTADFDQQFPTIISDGAGGALVTWEDARSGATWDVYAQHVQSSGTVDAAWPVNGRALSTATGSQRSPVLASDGAAGIIVAWDDARSGASNKDVYAQRVARFGFMGTPEAILAGVKDIPNDDGGKVKVSWTASYLELEPYSTAVMYYLFRSVPTHVAAQAVARGARLHETTAESLRPGDLVRAPAGATTLFWEMIASMNALAIPGYSYVASTTGDSLGAGNPKTLFMVQTHSFSSFWSSPPDSGYSVDNLPPAAPAPFTAHYATGTTQLDWNANTEPDLAGYRLYRGSSPSFVPSPATLFATPVDPRFTDVAGVPYVYKLTAIDIHGNESPVATIVPSGAAGVGDGPASSLDFAAPGPNPAKGATVLRYSLSRPGRVRLSAFDAAGRLVAMLQDGDQAAGAHAVPFALRDAGGRELASGIYLLQLEAEGRVLTQRLATIH